MEGMAYIEFKTVQGQTKLEKRHTYLSQSRRLWTMTNWDPDDLRHLINVINYYPHYKRPTLLPIPSTAEERLPKLAI